MKALILDNKVIQIDEVGFPVHESLQWIDCAEDCKAGWILLNGVLHPEPEAVKSIAELLQEMQDAIKSHLHMVALERDYDSPLSIATYIESKVLAWAAEAEIYIDWRDDVWSYAIEQLALFEGGYRELISADEFIAELPVIVWPN